MPDMPSGTITFLFTDIEGSSRLWELYPEVMNNALARHDAMLNSIITAHGGYVFKTVGDAFCAAFPTAPEALAAALTAQRALQGEAWEDNLSIRVRIALHTGMAEERDGDYFGPTLNRVARIRDTGYGGQTLLSQATQELVNDFLPEGVSLRDLGERRLRDLVRPERIFQMVADDLPDHFPPLKSLDNLPNNLPVQVTSFVGREREMAEIKNLLSKTHLLTLTGTGGAGKTRLSLQIAAEMLDQFADGVWFIELAPLSDPALVPQAVATVLSVTEETGHPVIQTLTNYLRGKTLLLILDNCEHLVEAAAQLANAIIRVCPNVRLLASSREALGIAGETAYRVPSLSLPQPGHLPPFETFSQYEAVRLFTERAIAVQPNFRLTRTNAPAVAQICASLDGIPLAIELAAALVKVLMVEQIAARLDDRFRLLKGGSRTALPRQQTLQALIDWSYDLLSETERLMLGRLSVFVGGWTLEAAEAVCKGAGIEDFEVLDLLSRLVDKSLVMMEEPVPGAFPPEARYRLLETIRQYMQAKLPDAGEIEIPRRHHADYYLGLAEAAAAKLSGAEEADWLNRLETEHDNLRAALDYLLKEAQQQAVAKEEEDTRPYQRLSRQELNRILAEEESEGQTSDPSEKALRLSSALVPFWYIHGYEGQNWLKAALATSRPEPTPGRANALSGAGALSWAHGDYKQARTLYDASLAAWRQLDDQSGIASSLNNLGNVAYASGDYARAQTFFEECLILRRELEDKWGLAASLNNLAVVAQAQGDYGRAMLLFEESLNLKRELEDRGGIAQTLNNLGAIAKDQGDYAGATALLEESLDFFRQMGNKRGIAMALERLGGVAYEQGKYSRAIQLHEESLELWRELGNRQNIAGTLCTLGEDFRTKGDYLQAIQLFNNALAIYQELGQKERIVECLNALAKVAWYRADYKGAETLYNQSLALHQELGNKRSVASSLRNLGRVAQYQGDYTRATRLFQESLDLSYEIDHRLGIASCLTRLAEVAGVKGRYERAARLYGAAEALREAIGAPLTPTKLLRFERKVAARTRQFNKEAFATAQAMGRTMPLEQAVNYALDEALT